MHNAPATENDHEDDAIYEALAALPRRPAPPGLGHAFRRRLGARMSPRWRRRPALLVALAAMLLLAVGAGWWHERQARVAEGQQLHTALVSALTSLSAVTRLQAITVASDAGTSDTRIVAVLTTALLSDSSANVRVAAAEALGHLADPGALSKAARESLRHERSPFVQAALLAIIVTLPQGDRVQLLRELLSRTDLDPQIRAEAEAGIRTT